MKRLLFLALMLPVFAMAQMGDLKPKTKKTTIGKLATMGYLQVELYYTADESDTVNTIMFRNARYQSIVDFKYTVFMGGVETRSKLKAAILSCFKEENVKDKDFDVSFTLGDDKILLFARRSFGTTQVVFYVNDDYFYMTEKQVHKLFGDE